MQHCSLVTGAGDTNNYLFTLDTNGTLKSAAIFDYESNSSTYSIRVQVKDDENASLAGIFSVALLDYNEGVSPTAGDGSANNPHQIATLANLRWLSITPSAWDDHILQVADINALATKSWDNGIGFPSIGSSSANQFTGHYDGNGYRISNLFVYKPEDMRAGMFGIVSSDGNITNLSLIDLNVTGKIYAGGLVGYLSGKVSKCYVSGTLNASGSSNGGMFGTISNTGLVEQCASEVDVRGGSSSANIGGFAGNINGTDWLVLH